MTDNPDGKNREALEHVQLAMAALDDKHIAHQYLLIAEAFLQREIVGKVLTDGRGENADNGKQRFWLSPYPRRPSEGVG